MRILTLSLKNLNSLKGEWHIDFTDPAYEDSGIFAITGQTGAGKTTILDAICLALYGETPRIANISGASNEVMTRRTGDCYAEVVITVAGKFYRCHWSQRRAYNKPDGKLQSAEHELSELACFDDVINKNAGNIIESKLSRTKGEIQAITGMDFQQFTRSALLAQGSFSAFLKANASERADILEKITGTDIYADISRRVHEKKRNNEQILKQLNATLDGIELLSAEDIKQISTELTEQKAEQAKLNDSLNTLNEQINWQNSIHKLTADITSQKIELSNAKQAISDFAPQATRLSQALKALEIDSDYQQLEHTRKRHSEQLAKQTQLNQQLATEQTNLTQANEQLTTAQTTLQQADTELQQQLPIINEVTALDNQLANSKQRLDDSQHRHDQLHSRLSEGKQQLEDNQQNVMTAQNQLAQITDYLTKHASHATLPLDRDNLINSCKSLKSLLLANVTADNELIVHREQGKAFASNKQQLEKQLTTINQQVNDKQQQFNKLQTDIDKLLNGKTINDWRDELTQLKEQFYQLTGVEQQQQSLSQLYKNLNKLQETGQTLQRDNQQLTANIDTKTESISKLENQLSSAIETLNLQQQVIKLEQYISTLQQDEHCPLCGATEHPYLADLANGSHPHFNPANSQMDRLNELQQQVDKFTKNQQSEQQQLAQLEKKLAVNSTQQAENDSQQNALTMEIDKLLQAIRATHAELVEGEDLASPTQPPPKGEEFPSFIDTLAHKLTAKKSQTGTAKQTCETVIGHYEQREQQLAECKADNDNLNSQLNSTQTQLNELISEEKLYQQQLSHLEQTINNNLVELTRHASEIEQILARHQTALPLPLSNVLNQSQSLSELQVESLLDELRSIAKHWSEMEKAYTSHSQQQIELEKAISSLQSSQNELKKQQKVIEQEFTQLSQTLDTQKHEYQQTLATRKQRFADKNPTAEEERLRKAVEQANTALSQAKEQQQALQHQVDGLTKELAELVKLIADNDSLLTKQQQQFAKQLTKHDFSDIQAFTLARLPQSEREQLQQQQNELNSQRERLQTLLENNEKSLAEQTAKQLTQTPLAELQTQAEETQTLSNQLAQQIGANQQKLNDNQAKLAKSSEQQQAIDKQRADSLVWEQLHKLIGSSDGQKFRNFAQGLTFDVMIHGANEQLQKMSDRYLLIRDDNEPLELNVIDNYQAGEIRSCKNLSGGESFIISLALALSLSNMGMSNMSVSNTASQNASDSHNNHTHNIQVDSLFLDEGFGTLDDDSLDIALDTLTSLQQQGKLIGVISHVQALKDRILTQIKVEKVSGGISRLSGAGVERGKGKK